MPPYLVACRLVVLLLDTRKQLRWERVLSVTIARQPQRRRLCQAVFPGTANGGLQKCGRTGRSHLGFARTPQYLRV